MVESPSIPLNDGDRNILINQYEEQLDPVHESLENNLMNPDMNHSVDIYLDIRAWVKERVETYEPLTY